MAEAAPPHPSIRIDTTPQARGQNGPKIGRPPRWTDSKSRKLTRLYVYTMLPLEKIIAAVFGDEQSVKYESVVDYYYFLTRLLG